MREFSSARSFAHITFFSLAVGWVLPAHFAAGQASIEVNFIGGFGGTDGSQVDGPAGVVSQSNWNNLGPVSASPTADQGGQGEFDAVGEAADLIDSTGAVTTTSLSWMSDNNWASANPMIDNADQRLTECLGLYVAALFFAACKKASLRSSRQPNLFTTS